MKRLNSLRVLTAVTAAVVSAAPAAADPTPIQVAAEATWQHDIAKVRFPPMIDGFRRTSIVDYGDQRLDVSARYFEDASVTTATLYLFRAPLPDAALWHDRALTSVRQHETLGTPDHAAAVTKTFVPPGSQIASGLLTVLPLSGRSARSTALAVFPQGPWLVKVRITSDELDPAQLGARLESLLAALPIDSLGPAQPATAMADCSGRLEFRRARRADRPDLATQLLLATQGLVETKAAESGAGAGVAEQKRFCRDPSSQSEYGVYRQDGAEDSYVIGLYDAGISIGVHRQSVAGLLDGNSAKDFWVDLSTLNETATYRGFRSLPAPAQVIEVINGEQPIAKVERNANGDSNITLTPD